MSSWYGPNIITDELVFLLDAGNTKSYPGDASIWYDLKNSYQGQMTDVDYFNGAMSFNSTTDKVTFGDILEMGTSDFTLGIWTNISDFSGNYQGLLGRGYLAGNVTGYGLLCFNEIKFEFQDRITSPTSAKGCRTITSLETDKWYYVVGTRTYNDYLRIYLNGKFETDSNSLTPGVDTYDLSGGTYEGIKVGSNYLDSYTLRAGKIAIIHINKKAFSETEVLQNFNVMKGRFGL